MMDIETGEAGFVERRNAGLRELERMLSPEAAKAIDGSAARGGFANYMAELSLRNVFAEIWARPGLDPRSRSLVTLGILIALRATGEQRVHFGIALNNGLTVPEIEEVLYHATAYAGFPAANSAREVAAEALRELGAIG